MSHILGIQELRMLFSVTINCQVTKIESKFSIVSITTTDASSATCWPNLKPMQVVFFLAGELS